MTMQMGVVSSDGTKREMLAGDCEMAKMGPEGDTKTIWDKNNPDEVANAKRTFDDLRKKSYVAFYVTGKNGETGNQMEDFDPDAERMVMIPPMQGG